MFTPNPSSSPSLSLSLSLLLSFSLSLSRSRDVLQRLRVRTTPEPDTAHPKPEHLTPYTPLLAPHMINPNPCSALENPEQNENPHHKFTQPLLNRSQTPHPRPQTPYPKPQTPNTNEGACWRGCGPGAESTYIPIPALMLWCFVLNPHRRSSYPKLLFCLTSKLRLSSPVNPSGPQTPHPTPYSTPDNLHSKPQTPKCDIVDSRRCMIFWRPQGPESQGSKGSLDGCAIV